MTKLIRIVVAGLSLCGAVAVLPGVAEAREPDRAVAGHVEQDRRGEHGGRGERGHEGRGEHRGWHDGRGEHRGWHDGRGRYGHGGGRRAGC